MPNSKASLTRAGAMYVVAVTALLPLFFLPVTREYYATAKWMLLGIDALGILIIWATRLTVAGSFDFSRSMGVRAFAALTVASFASLAVSSTNRLEGLTSVYGPMAFVSALVIVLLGETFMDRKYRAKLMDGLYTVSALVGITVIYQQFGVGKILFPGSSIASDPLWNPTGTPAGFLVLVLVLAPFMVRDAVHAVRSRAEVRSAMLVLAATVIAIAGAITLWRYIPKAPSSVLPLGEGVSIAFRSLSTPKTILVGVGPERFLQAFTAARNISLNLTPVWNVLFSSNASLFLHIVTVYGFAGIAGCGVLAFALWTALGKTTAGKVTALLYMGAFLLAPPSFILIPLAVILFLADDTERITRKSVHPAPAIAVGILVIMVALGTTYMLLRYYRGEMAYYRSLNTGNNGTTMYNLQIRAIKTSPWMSQYHAAYSQTSQLLANAILEGPAGDKTALTDEDRALATDLLSQSIREAKLATQLSPGNAIYWSNLGWIYQNLIGVAEKSDEWSVASYTKAIQLDPSNPTLRLDLGTVYANTGKHQDAVRQFLTAVTIKPDYANALYNMANSYRLMGDTESATKAISQTRSLIPETSPEYGKIETMENLIKNGDTKEASPSGVPQLETQSAPEVSGSR